MEDFADELMFNAGEYYGNFVALIIVRHALVHGGKHMEYLQSSEHMIIETILCKTLEEKKVAWQVLLQANPDLEKEIDNFHGYTEKVFRKALIMSANIGCEPVGIIAFYMNDYVSRTAYITQVAVNPLYQGRGIGKLLLSRFLSISKEAGMTTAKLEVKKRNERAKQLYRTFGFREIEEASFESIYMELKLISRTQNENNPIS